MPNMFPNGMGMNAGMGGMVGMPMNMPNMGMGINPAMNMCMGMGMMGMPNNFNMNMPQMNVGGNDNWAQGYNTSSPMTNNSNSTGNKINCLFIRANGNPIIILIEHGKSINELIKIFFKRVEQPELINNNLDICFIYNATKIDINSRENVEDFFKFNSNPRIIVNDVHNLIGA